ncbi:MAG: hypothetical protein IPK85_01890 [Gemmatimonadetes bacterium]|nr:hypothetical protein [Gemmatimonadota bacterium]
MISDLTTITITDEDGHVEWSKLGQLIADNADAMDERDAADLRAELAAYRTYHMGGGSGPLFTIRNVEPIA